MSDKNQGDEEVNERKTDGKISKNKLKSERELVEKNINNGQEKSGINPSHDEKHDKLINSSDSEERSLNHPKLKKDLKELFDNFGQDKPNPAANNPPSYSTETFEILQESSETYPQQSVENIASTDDIMQTNNDYSIDDSTLNDKIIEIKDDSHNCSCHPENCVCDRYNQNLTDIDNCQAYFEANQKTPFGFGPNPGLVDKSKECPQKYEDSNYDRTNRYNYNQIHIRQNQKEIPRLEHFFPRREKKIKHYISKDESGETIPQLYKANVKHFETFGVVPERFTFKAVTGHYPGNLECMTPYTYPSCKSEKHKVNFAPDCCTEINRKNRRKGRKSRNSFFKIFTKNQKHKFPEKKRSEAVKHHQSFHTHGTDKNKLQFHDKAYTQFDEYVSTKQLPDRIDIYCFDHLNTSYFRTCDQPPPLITDIAMEKTEEVATRFWAEIFGFVHIIIAFLIAFILQLYKFFLYSIVRPMMVGIVQLTSDYFFKPLLTITYNGFTQPLMVFLFNVAASFRDLCSPIAKCLGYFTSEIATLLRAIRFVDCSKHTAPTRLMKDSYC